MAREATSRKRGPHQLPAGRHGLPRDFVVRNQRERLLAAVGEVSGVSTYAAMTVEDIIAAAGVSRRTFYDHFRSKDDAFLASYDAYAARLRERVDARLESAEGFAARVAALLEAMLEYFATEPGAAHVCVVEALAAGPAAIQRRAKTLAWLVDLVEDAAGSLPKRGRPSRFVAETLLGGVYESIHARAIAGKLDELPEIGPDLIALVTLPYVGADRSAAARRSAKARLRRRSR
jgi:AcrR family transcriptional regulator